MRVKLQYKRKKYKYIERTRRFKTIEVKSTIILYCLNLLPSKDKIRLIGVSDTLCREINSVGIKFNSTRKYDEINIPISSFIKYKILPDRKIKRVMVKNLVVGERFVCDNSNLVHIYSKNGYYCFIEPGHEWISNFKDMDTWVATVK